MRKSDNSASNGIATAKGYPTKASHGYHKRFSQINRSVLLMGQIRQNTNSVIGISSPVNPLKESCGIYQLKFGIPWRSRVGLNRHTALQICRSNRVWVMEGGEGSTVVDSSNIKQIKELYPKSAVNSYLQNPLTDCTYNILVFVQDVCRLRLDLGQHWKILFV